MDELKPTADDEPERVVKGKYFDEWIKFRGRISKLYTTKDGHVDYVQVPKECRRGFPTLNGYTVEFSNQGGLRKFNPNPLNYKFAPRQRAFSKCLVEDCLLPANDMWGLCSATNHTTRGEIKTRHGRKTTITEGWVDMSRIEHLVDWEGSLKEVSSQNKIFAPEHSAPSELLLGWAGESKERGETIDDFVRDLLKNRLVGKVKDSTTMQLEFEADEDPAGNLVQRIGKAVDAHFRDSDGQMDWPRKDFTFKGVPIKCIAAMMALGFAAEEANRNDLWFVTDVQGLPAERSRYASAYMSATYFLLRRAGASPNQARMSQRTM